MNCIASLSIIIGLMIAAHLMCQQTVPTSSGGESRLHLPRIIPQADAFPLNALISNTRGVVHERTYNMPAMMATSSSVANDATHINENSSDNNMSQAATDDESLCYTTAILKVSYDGTHFSGWTGGNAGEKPNQSKPNKPTNSNNNNKKPTQKQSQKQRQ